VNWREPPNDWFACKLLLSIAIGRLGCMLAGCCRGLPTNATLSLSYSDGVPRVPIAPMELLFHAGLFALFLHLRRHVELRGKLFALYLVVYGVFRFATEPLRETPKPLSGFSVYQLLALALIGAGAWSLLRRFPAAMSEQTE
jgi:phosphatidylglycerol---prolipoprotein diacylglyceryl transferase